MHVPNNINDAKHHGLQSQLIFIKNPKYTQEQSSILDKKLNLF